MQQLPAADTQPRRRDPDALRRRLLQAARDLALSEGLAAVTIQSVAQRAGATKGGLFHHFTSKERLLEALFQEELESLDQFIDAEMARDETAYGRFTRAYIASVLTDDTPASLYAVLMLSKDLTALWEDWLLRRAAQHGETDSRLTLARYAADGIWINRLWGSTHHPDTAEDGLRQHILTLTHEGPTP